MRLSQDEAAVLARFRVPNPVYGKIQDDSGFKKGKFYGIVKKLIAEGALKKTRVGKYEAIANVEFEIATKRARRARASVTPPPVVVQPEVVIEPPPPATPDIENLAATLIDKVADLRPLLMLHKELFADIERITLALIDKALDLHGRALTPEQMQEYKDLIAVKQRAVEIVKALPNYKPKMERMQ